MKEFDIIDSHIHLTRSLQEECDYYSMRGRRSRDRWATPDRIITYLSADNGTLFQC